MLLLRLVSLAVCFMVASCVGPARCDEPDIVDIKKVEVELFDNSTNVPQTLQGRSSLPANALALQFAIRDSVVKSVYGCYKQYRQTIVNLNISAILKSSSSRFSVVGQLYLRRAGKQAPVMWTNANQIADGTVLLCYGELPVYGPQRWLIEVTLSDGRTLSATTPEINLTH